MLKKIQQKCKKNGIHLTKLRLEVLQLIWQAKKPIKAYDLLDLLKKSNPNAKPNSVYRSLDFLIKNHLAHKINKHNCYVACAHPNDCQECYFLLCKSCHSISECCNTEISATIHQQSKMQGFQPQEISLEIGGFCANCQNQTIEKSEQTSNY